MDMQKYFAELSVGAATATDTANMFVQESQAPTRAYNEGRAGWQAGKTHNDNPYQDSELADRWNAGLLSAAHED